MESKELTVKSNYAITVNNAIEAFQNASEELAGLPIKFQRIQIPSGGGLAFEVPSDNPDNPDTVKEIKGVILYHHPVHAYYTSEYTGGNNPPDCGSINGVHGVNRVTGEITQCEFCENFQFGSGKDGGKACKQKRRLYILREGELLPTVITIPTGSLTLFSNYVMSLVNKNLSSNGVVTRFTLKKATNKNGIVYSQVVFAADKMLKADEKAAIKKMAEQIKNIVNKTNFFDDINDEELKEL
jgi:hypothetical protein